MKKIIPISNQISALNARPINTEAPLTGDATLSGLKNSPPLSLYIHIPWCVKKCPYCDFNSHESKKDIPETSYVDALIADLEQAVPNIWGRKIRSIFFGGGTPSLFSDDSIDRILSYVRMLTQLEYGAEITLEANPGTVDAAHFSGYKQAGVNRLSLGIQSFNDKHLYALGRIHNQVQAKQAINLALNTFDQVNLDVMYGLPNQTLEQALEDAQTALDFNTAHLSFYHLTLEPNTAFYHTPPSLPDDDLSAVMQEQIELLLKNNGYQHYETSAFAKPNKKCRHNLNYWQFGDYLGIGAGAHSKLSYHDKMTRESRYKHPKQYMENVHSGKHIEQTQIIGRDELGFEFMMNALRLNDGVPVSLFVQHTGLNLNTLNSKLHIAQSKGLLETSLSVIKPTLRGQRYLNDLLQIFLD
ncbi:MAG: oxygen-independent coproporphyrinogen III oxidase-like protein [Methylophilaceae bacterium]|nr:oxygen-independent coproporphyrinogen III oxidase-like protein [Methylophilaceae bacterium]